MAGIAGWAEEIAIELPQPQLWPLDQFSQELRGPLRCQSCQGRQLLETAHLAGRQAWLCGQGGKTAAGLSGMAFSVAQIPLTGVSQGHHGQSWGWG